MLSLATLLISASLVPPRVLTTLKQPITTIRWNADLLKAGRSPLRLGIDVEVRENGIGRGLYALRTIAAGALVERYSGPVTTYDAFMASDSSGRYAMALSNGDVVDGEDERRSGYVRFINHSVRKANCRNCEAFRSQGGPLAVAYIETLRAIQPGEELLFDYGPEYWEAMGVPRFSPLRLKIDYL